VADDLRSALRAVIAEHDPEQYEAEGDHWLYRFSPDDAELMVDALTDAIVRVVEARRG
jgi:hypothetical protein